MQLVYFAWVREVIGKDGETLVKPDNIHTLGELVTWLQSRGDNYQAALGDLSRLRAAINHDFAGWQQPISDDDEIAIFPPVTGGMQNPIEVRIQTECFDAGLEQQQLINRLGGAEAGAVVAFTGLVRGGNDAEEVQQMTLEHYPAMTEKALQKIAREAERRWPLLGGLIIHRVGTLKPGEPIVLAITLSAHRQAAFEAAMFLVDWLKTRAPFWKQEAKGDKASWVEARLADDHAARRWER